LIAWNISRNPLSGGLECRVRYLAPEKAKERAHVTFFSRGITLLTRKNHALQEGATQIMGLKVLEQARPFS